MEIDIHQNDLLTANWNLRWMRTPNPSYPNFLDKKDPPPPPSAPLGQD